MIRAIFIFGFQLWVLSAFIVSCSQQSGTNEPASSDPGVSDTAIIRDPKSNLNIQTTSFSEIDSSGILMFPLSMSEGKRENKGSYYKTMPGSSYWNVVFYNSKTSGYHLLSEKKILISSIDVRYSGGEYPDIQQSSAYIFYRVISDDINGDNKLDSDDPEYLYVSDKEGKNFRQVSPPGHDLLSWLYVSSVNKIIMSVTIDTDKNKDFGGTDEVIAFEADPAIGAAAAPIFSNPFKDSLKILFDRDWKKNKD